MPLLQALFWRFLFLEGVNTIKAEEKRRQSVWLDDGVCYANLLSSTVPADTDREEAGLALQALRDSLASLDSVQEVRILVNGELAQYYAGISLRTSTRATQ